MKKILLGIIIITLTLSFVGCGKKQEETSETDKVSTATLTEKTVDGLKINNFSLVYEDGMTNIYADVTNENEQSMYVKKIDFTLKDEEGTVLGNFYFYIDKVLEPNSPTSFQLVVSSDVTTAADAEYVIITE